MRKTLLSIALITTMSQANCLLTQADDINVSWRAFKTLSKIGVGGAFTNIKYTPNKKQGKNFQELFVGSKVLINTSKIDTKNPQRDKTIVENFFNKLKGGKIEGVIKSIKRDKGTKDKKIKHSGVVVVEISMNGKSLDIPMRYRYKNEVFKAKGVIDIFDFNGTNALKSINRSCYDLHKGKTWNDMEISFATTIKASLCGVKVEGNVTKKDVNNSTK